MARTPQTFHIQDDDGNDVVYHITPFGAGQGAKILRQLLPILVGPLAQAIGSLSKQGDDVKVDGAGLEGAIRGLSQALASHGDDDLYRRLLSGAIREQAGAKIKPYEAMGFDSAYQANYGELFEALYISCKINFSGMIRRIMRDLGNGEGLDGLIKRFSAASS